MSGTKKFSMKQVRHILNDKARDVWSLPPDATVYEAIEQMAQKGIVARASKKRYAEGVDPKPNQLQQRPWRVR